MAALGSVVVELSANIAKFETGLTKAAAVAQSQMASIDKSLGIVKTSLGVLGAGFLANATFDKIKEKITGAIESAAGLQQLSERTGVAAGALSGLVGVAKLSSTGADELAGGLQKLSKAMIDAENGGKKTSASFAAIGISTDEIKGKNPAEVFKKISTSLAQYQDGAEKLVITQNLLGKAGANLLPVLKDLAEVGDLQIKVTDKQAAQADEYEKNLVRFNVASQGIYKVIALEAVPALNDFVKVLIEAQTKTGGFTDAAKKLAKEGSLREFFEEAATDAALFIDAISRASSAFAVFQKTKQLGSSFLFGEKGETLFRSKYNDSTHPENETAGKKRRELLDNLKTDFDVLVNGTNKYSEKLKETFAQRRRVESAAYGGEARAVVGKKVINTSSLGNENVAKGPKDDPAQKLLDGQLKAQEDFVASQNKLLGQREQALSYYSGLEYITLADELESKKRLIAETLMANQAAYDKEAALLQNRIKTADTDVKRQDARNKLQEVGKRRAEATVDANNRIGQSQQALLAIQRQFDLSTSEASRQADKSNSDAQFQIDLLGKSTLEVQKLTSARQIQAAVDERIFQLRKKDPTADVSKALEDAADQQARAGVLIEQSYAKQRTEAFGASEAIRKYGEDAANVGAQIESSLTNAFKGAEDAFVTFTTTGKLSFSGLAQSIIADFARMQAKSLVSKLIGGGGFGGLLSGLFGGGTELSTAAAGIGDAGAIGSFMSGLGFANGGSPPVGKASLVGEAGPELFIPQSAGTIIPNGALGGGANVTYSPVINIDSRSDRAAIQADVNRAVANGNAQLVDRLSRAGRI